MILVHLSSCTSSSLLPSLATTDPDRNSVVSRLAASFHLFHYLAYAPNATLKIAEFFQASPFVGLHDRFNVAFGMMAFAGLPDWAEGTGEAKVLVELACTSPLFLAPLLLLEK